MLRYTVGVLILLPQSLLGLILLTSHGSILGQGNTSNLNIDDFLDDDHFQIPSSNLNKENFPLEWGDVTISRDVIHRKKKLYKSQRRYNKIHHSNIFNKNEVSINQNGKTFSDFAPTMETISSESNRIRQKRSELKGGNPFLIHSDSRSSKHSQHHYNEDSLHSKLHVFRPSSSDALPSAQSSKSEENSQHFRHRHDYSSLASISSLVGTSGKLHPSFKGSNIQRMNKLLKMSNLVD